MPSDQEPTWQPIEALPMVAALIDGELEACQDQYRTLLEDESRPYALDDATVARVARVYGVAAADLWLYDTQLGRWGQEDLTSAQHAEVERLRQQVVALHEVVEALLALAGRLSGQTIESLMAKSDLKVGLEGLLGRHVD